MYPAVPCRPGPWARGHTWPGNLPRQIDHHDGAGQDISKIPSSPKPVNMLNDQHPCVYALPATLQLHLADLLATQRVLLAWPQ